MKTEQDKKFCVFSLDMKKRSRKATRKIWQYFQEFPQDKNKFWWSWDKPHLLRCEMRIQNGFYFSKSQTIFLPYEII